MFRPCLAVCLALFDLRRVLLDSPELGALLCFTSRQPVTGRCQLCFVAGAGPAVIASGCLRSGFSPGLSRRPACYACRDLASPKLCPAARKGTHTQGAAATATVQSIPGVAAPLLPSPEVQVSTAASEAMLAACGTAGNRDLEPHIPALVSCIAKPAEVPDVIAKLSATTFVQVGATFAALSWWVLRTPLQRRGTGCCRHGCAGPGRLAFPAAATRRQAPAPCTNGPWLPSCCQPRRGVRTKECDTTDPGCRAPMCSLPLTVGDGGRLPGRDGTAHGARAARAVHRGQPSRLCHHRKHVQAGGCWPGSPAGRRPACRRPHGAAGCCSWRACQRATAAAKCRWPCPAMLSSQVQSPACRQCQRLLPAVQPPALTAWPPCPPGPAACRRCKTPPRRGPSCRS